MKENAVEVFFAGAVSSIILLTFALWLADASPAQVEKNYKNKAISLGYATNVIVLKKDAEYGLEFRWITNR